MNALPIFRPNYRDRLLRLIVVPLLGIMYRHIGEPSPLIQLLRDPIYYADLLVCMASVWISWELTKWLIRRLDRYYSWINDFFRRLIIQLVVVYGIAIFYTLLVTFVYNDIIMRDLRHELYDISFAFVIDVPVSLLMLTIVQLLYYTLYLQEYYTQPVVEAASLPSAPAFRKNVLAYFGKSLLPVALEEIAYFHKVGEVTLVRIFGNQDYRIDQTLEQLMDTLPASHFYRLNRRMIASLEAVREVKSDASGKLLVTLEPDYEEIVTVSRKKASEFKNWLNG